MNLDNQYNLNNEYEAQWLLFAICIIKGAGCNASMSLGLKEENAGFNVYMELSDYVNNGRVIDKIFYDKLAYYAMETIVERVSIGKNI